MNRVQLDALLVTARKHRRLIGKLDGVTDISDLELVGDVGWSVRITIIANEDGWFAMGLLKTAGADLVVEGCESVDFSEFQLTVGVLWQCTESFFDNLLEVLAVEQWLAKFAGVKSEYQQDRCSRGGWAYHHPSRLAAT